MPHVKVTQRRPIIILVGRGLRPRRQTVFLAVNWDNGRLARWQPFRYRIGLPLHFHKPLTHQLPDNSLYSLSYPIRIAAKFLRNGTCNLIHTPPFPLHLLKNRLRIPQHSTTACARAPHHTLIARVANIRL